MSFLDVDVGSIDDGRAILTLRALSWMPNLTSQRIPSSISTAQRLNIDDVSESIQAMGALDLCGSEWIDTDSPGWARWRERRSVDYGTGHQAPPHHVHLFKEQFRPTRTLDLKISFDSLSVSSEDGHHLGLDEFVRCGSRWWDAVHAGAEQTATTGIVRETAEPERSPEPAGDAR